MPSPCMCRKCLLSMIGRHEGLQSPLPLVGPHSAVIIGLLQFCISNCLENGLPLDVGPFLFLANLST